MSSYKVSASIAVTDMARAEVFYEERLGLLGVHDQADGSHRYVDVALNAIGIPHVQGTPFADLSVDDYLHPITAYCRTNFVTAQADRTLLGRWPTLADVAEAAAFVASDRAAATTGTVVNLTPDQSSTSRLRPCRSGHREPLRLQLRTPGGHGDAGARAPRPIPR